MAPSAADKVHSTVAPPHPQWGVETTALRLDPITSLGVKYTCMPSALGEQAAQTLLRRHTQPLAFPSLSSSPSPADLSPRALQVAGGRACASIASHLWAWRGVVPCPSRQGLRRTACRGGSRILLFIQPPGLAARSRWAGRGGARAARPYCGRQAGGIDGTESQLCNPGRTVGPDLAQAVQSVHANRGQAPYRVRQIFNTSHPLR